MDGLWWKTLLKWMIWGYPYFRKHPYKLTWISTGVLFLLRWQQEQQQFQKVRSFALDSSRLLVSWREEDEFQNKFVCFFKSAVFSTFSNCLKMCMVVFCQKTAEFCWEILGRRIFDARVLRKKTYPFLPLFNGNVSLRNCKCRFFRTTFATGMHIMFWSWNFQRVRYKLNLDGGFIFFFTPIWGRFPFWLKFFKWVDTTNQEWIC